MTKTNATWTVLAGCAILSGLAAVPAAATLEEFSGEVVEVKDGDTLEVLRNGLEVEIRLAGVDAPEAGQAFGKLARDGLAHAVLGKVVDVRVLGRDLDTCPLARIYLGDFDINLELVKAGLAWHYRQRKPLSAGQRKQLSAGQRKSLSAGQRKQISTDQAFRDAQKAARKARRGLWQAGLRPIPPWEYRRALEEAEALDLDRANNPEGYGQSARPGG